MILIALLVLGVCWGWLARMVEGSFWIHMVMHMGVVAVAAPLLALGVAGTRGDPVCWLPWLGVPIIASVVELVVVWGWHAPVPHHFARHDGWGLALEQGSFLATGFWIWISAFGGAEVGRRERMAGGVIGLLLTSMHMTLLGALLALAQRPLYDHGMAEGDSVLRDQEVGGVIMLVVGGISYLAGGLWLVRGLLRGEREVRS